MSSMQVSGAPTRSPLMIDLDDQVKKKHVANPLDLDGDGKIDGESLSGESGDVANANLINQILQARGLKVQGGDLESVDGFKVGGANMSVVTEFDGIPPAVSADDLSGDFAPAADVSRSLRSFLDSSMGAGALMWQELMTMAESSQRELQLWKELKNAQQESKAQSKMNEIEATEQQIDAQRSAAVTNFVWSAVGSAVSFGLGRSGMNDQNSNQMLMKTLADSRVGELVSEFGRMTDQVAGAQAEADEKRTEVLRHQMMQEVLDQGIETSKSAYEMAVELFKLAIKIIDEHAERETQITSTITRG